MLQGYCSGNPDKRMNIGTSLQYVGMFGLIGTALKFAYDLLNGETNSN